MIEGHVDINESHQSVIDLVLNLAMMGGHLQRVLKRILFSHQENMGLLKVPKKSANGRVKSPPREATNLQTTQGCLIIWPSWESNGTPPMPPPQGNKALLPLSLN